MVSALPAQLEYAILFGLMAIVLVGLLVTVLALRGRLVAARGRCAACGHTLHDPLPERCGECGAAIGEPGSIAWGEVRNRPVLAIVSAGATFVAFVALSVVPLVLFGGIGMNAAVRESNRLLALDPQELAEAVRQGDDRSVVWSAIDITLASPHLTREQALAAAEGAVDFAIDQATNRSGSPSTMGGDLLARVLQSGLLRDEDVASIAKRALGPIEVVAPRQVAAESTAELHLMPLSARLATALSGVEFTPLVEAIAVRSAAADPPDESASATTATVEDDGRRVHLTAPQPGSFELELVAVVRVTADGAGLRRVVLTDPSVFSVTLDPIVHELRVVDADALEPLRIDDPEKADRVAAAITVRRLAIARDLDGARSVLELAMAVRPIDVAALDFDVFVEFDGSDGGGVAPEPMRVGHVAVHRRGMADVGRPLDPEIIQSRPEYRFVQWIPDLPAAITSATVVLVPADRLRSTTATVTEVRDGTRQERLRRTVVDAVWAAPVRIEGIEVVRTDGADGAVREETRP